MHHNELYMTLYGCLNGGGNVDDPHVDGEVYDPTESEQKSYNRQMVNKQVNTVLFNEEIDLRRLEDYDITFTIDPISFLLKVTSVEDEELKNKMEGALNSGENELDLYKKHLKTSDSIILGHKNGIYDYLKVF